MILIWILFLSELLYDPPSNGNIKGNHCSQVYHLPLGADQVKRHFTTCSIFPVFTYQVKVADGSSCNVFPPAARWQSLWEDSHFGMSYSSAEERPAWSDTSTARRPKDYGRRARYMCTCTKSVSDMYVLRQKAYKFPLFSCRCSEIHITMVTWTTGSYCLV